MCTVLSIFLFYILLKEKLSALQPLAIGNPTEVHCPQVCLRVCVCVCGGCGWTSGCGGFMEGSNKEEKGQMGRQGN